MINGLAFLSILCMRIAYLSCLKCEVAALRINCTDNEHLKWYYDRFAKRCRSFYYGGCSGSSSRFETYDQCRKKCCNDLADRSLKNGCNQTYDVSKCFMCDEFWYFDTNSRNWQSGCWSSQDGSNNFISYEQCIRVHRASSTERRHSQKTFNNPVDDRNQISSYKVRIPSNQRQQSVSKLETAEYSKSAITLLSTTDLPSNIKNRVRRNLNSNHATTRTNAYRYGISQLQIHYKRLQDYYRQVRTQSDYAYFLVKFEEFQRQSVNLHRLYQNDIDVNPQSSRLQDLSNRAKESPEFQLTSHEKSVHSNTERANILETNANALNHVNHQNHGDNIHSQFGSHFPISSPSESNQLNANTKTDAGDVTRRIMLSDVSVNVSMEANSIYSPPILTSIAQSISDLNEYKSSIKADESIQSAFATHINCNNHILSPLTQQYEGSDWHERVEDQADANTNTNDEDANTYNEERLADEQIVIKVVDIN